MFDIHHWMGELILRLKQTFGTRVVAVGLQGSFKRGEVHDKSDIDAVVVLDQLSLADLSAYKKILADMPASSHPACGFISGKEDLKNWSRAELFQFAHDTDTLYGSFEEILPAPTRQAALEAAQTGAGTLFHALCHTQVHGEVTPAFLAQLYKGAFFVLQAVYFAKTGEYVADKKTLVSRLSGLSKKILETLLTGSYSANTAKDLFGWCQDTLAYAAAELGDIHPAAARRI